VRYLAARSNNGLTDFNRFGDNVSLRADGVYISGGEYNPRLQSTWSDTTLTGNASWTLVFVVKPTSDSSVGIFGTPNIPTLESRSEEHSSELQSLTNLVC